MSFGMVRTGNADKPVAGIKKGTFAIWDPGPGKDDWSPVLAPKSYLDKVVLHSDLDYIGAILTLEATHSFGGGGYGFTGTVNEVEIGTHGLGYRPMILGEFSLDGTTWYTCNSSTLVNRAADYDIGVFGRRFLYLADDTKVYAVVFQSGNLGAQNIHFRVRVLERNFYSDRPSNGYAWYRDAFHVEACGGRFDTRRRYLQAPSPGQTATLRHFGGETMGFTTGPYAAQINLGICTDFRQENASCANSAQAEPESPFIIDKTPTEMVLDAPGTLNGIYSYANGRLLLGDGSGAVVFDSSRKTLAFVDEFKTEFSVPSRPAVGSWGAGNPQGPQEAIHFSQPVTTGADIIFGWIEFLSADSGATITVNKPVEFSGSLVVTGWFFKDPAYTYMWQRGFSMLAPRIYGGNMQVIERYYNFGVYGAANVPLPGYTVRCHLFACALTGGI